jgi:hypothetical protein
MLLLAAQNRKTAEEYCLGDHLKTGHTLSLQNRPTGIVQNKSSYTLNGSIVATFFAILQ